MTGTSNSLPSLFLSHGAPNILLYPSGALALWQSLATRLPRPSAVLVMSAHFPAAQATFEKGDHPGTIHDFGGFEPELYDMTYPAPGRPRSPKRLSASPARLAFQPRCPKDAAMTMGPGFR